MSITNKINAWLPLFLFSVFILIGSLVPVHAAQNIPPGCPGGPMGPPAPNTVCPGEDVDETKQARNECKTSPLTVENCPLLKDYVVPAVNALSGAVGVIIVIMIVWGGIQYTSARDNPQEAASAKKHIYNAVLALVIYIFMVAFLNWIVPGGVF